MITVNTNMASLIAQKSFNKATNSMNTALNRLSTGLRINSSKDDAAGSAVVTKFDYKINSLDISVENAQMGSSMLDTAEGTLDVIQKNLERIRELTEQAANGTYGDDALKAIKSEVQGRLDEIDRISESTDFNGRKLLDGSIKDGVNLQVGINADENSVINLSKDLFKSTKSSDLLEGGVMKLDKALVCKSFIQINDKYYCSDNPYIGKEFKNYPATLIEVEGEKAIKNVKNSFAGYGGGTEVEDVLIQIRNLDDLADFEYDNNIIECSEYAAFRAVDKNGNPDKFYLMNDDSGATFIATSGSGTANDPFKGYEFEESNDIQMAWDVYYKDKNGNVASGILFNVITDEILDNNVQDSFDSSLGPIPTVYYQKQAKTKYKTDLDIIFSNSDSARNFLSSVDGALDNIVSRKTEIGAYQQRLSSAMEVSNVMSTNLTAASSLIKDADIAKESANYVKNQILQQTTASLLATANQNPNIALNLL